MCKLSKICLAFIAVCGAFYSLPTLAVDMSIPDCNKLVLMITNNSSGPIHLDEIAIGEDNVKTGPSVDPIPVGSSSDFSFSVVRAAGHDIKAELTYHNEDKDHVKESTFNISKPYCHPGSIGDIGFQIGGAHGLIANVTATHNSENPSDSGSIFLEIKDN